MNYINSVKINSNNFPTSEHYPFSLQIFRKTEEVHFSNPVVFFVGENGTGKSTLLEAIARASGIHIWDIDEGDRLHVNRYEKELYRYISLERSVYDVKGSFYGSGIFNNFRKKIDNWAASSPELINYFGGKSLVTQSHGQSMMSYFRSRYVKKGIYFLDEPETALSPKTQLDFLRLLENYAESGHAQFFIATHSPILLAFENSEIYSFDKETIRKIEYRDTDHYRVYKDFLINH